MRLFQNNKKQKNDKNKVNDIKEKKITSVTFFLSTMISRASRRNDLYNVVEIPFNKGLDMTEIQPTQYTYIIDKIFTPDINGVIYFPLWYNGYVDDMYIFQSIATQNNEAIEKKISSTEWKKKTLSNMNIAHMEINFNVVKEK